MTNSETNKSTSFTRDAAGLGYVLLPCRFGADFAELPLYNRLFNYWLEFWTQVLLQNGTNNKIDPKDFLLFDYASLLLDPAGGIAGFMLHRVLNFHQEPTAFHPYLNSDFRAFANSHPTHLAMTVEYVTVDAGWRKPQTGLSVSQTLLRLAAHLQVSLDADISFIKARQDVKVSDSVLKLGGETLRANIDMHNTPVSFQVFKKESWMAHPDAAVENLSSRLWQERRDYRFQTLRKVDFRNERQNEDSPINLLHNL